MKFSQTLKTLLECTKIKLVTLSKEVDCESSNLSRYANGRLLPKLNQINSLAEKLAKSFSDIIIEDQNINVVSSMLNLPLSEENLEAQLQELLMKSYHQEYEELSTIKSGREIFNTQKVYYENEFLALIDEIVLTNNTRLWFYLPDSFFERVVSKVHQPFQIINPTAAQLFKGLIKGDVSFFQNKFAQQFFIYTDNKLILFNIFKETKKVIVCEVKQEQMIQEMNHILKLELNSIYHESVYDYDNQLLMLLLKIKPQTVLVNTIKTFGQPATNLLMKQSDQNLLVIETLETLQSLQKIHQLGDLNVKFANISFQCDWLLCNEGEAIICQQGNVYSIDLLYAKNLYQQLKNIKPLTKHEISQLTTYQEISSMV